MYKNALCALVAGVLLSPAMSLAGPVDINTADAMTIAEELKGVGLSKAEAIVQYREMHGDFGAPEDLLNVKGIGLQIYEVNRQNILVSNRD